MLNKAELMKLPLNRLRLIDVTNGEDEKVLQEIVSLKMEQMPPAMEVSRIDVPDIKNKEEEEKWQKIVDERGAKLKSIASTSSAPIELKIEEKKEELKEINKEIKLAVSLKCPQCDFVGKNANGVRLHSKKHK